MKYENPHYRKVRNSQIWIVSCNFCDTEISRYQKVGIGNLQRMSIERIIEGNIDFTNPPNELICPNCGEKLATKIHIKKGDREVYRMKRSTFGTRIADH